MIENKVLPDFELASPDDFLTLDQCLLLFHKPHCPNCMILKKVIQKGLGITPEMQIAGIDIEAHPKYLDMFNISRVPTLITFRAGKEASRKSGVMKPRELIGLYQGN